MPLNSVKYIQTVAKVCKYMMSTHSKVSYRLVIRGSRVRTKAFPTHVTLISSLSSRSAASMTSLFPDLLSQSVAAFTSSLKTFMRQNLSCFCHQMCPFLFLPEDKGFEGPEPLAISKWRQYFSTISPVQFYSFTFRT